MDYYVYVYIDPRNYEEFYYGKGRGSRKLAHLKSQADNEKTKRIAAIKRAGLEPIIRVVAKGLSERDALLVEKTLLHRLGKSLTNVSSGHFADNFRPLDSMHLELPEFDFESGIYYYNVGEGPHRTWEDYRKYGFISAGQGPKWVRAIGQFKEGDLIGAYYTRKGFVGIGIVTHPAKPIRDVKIKGRPILSLNLACKNMDKNVDRNDKCEHVALVKWVKDVPVSQAKSVRGKNLYTPQAVRASLEKHPKTRAFLEHEFKVSFAKLAR